MTKKIWMLLFAVLMLFTVFFQVEAKMDSANKNKSKPIIKIGVFLPMKGEKARVGKALKNSLFLAKDDIKYQRPKNDYQFIINNSNEEDIAAIYNQQKNQNKVNAIISFDSKVGGVISPLAERDKIIHINFGAFDDKNSQGRYNFINWTSPHMQQERMFEFFTEQNYKKVFLIKNKENNFDISEIAKKHNIIVETLDFNVDDVENILKRIKEQKADACLLQLDSEDVFSFVNQYKNFGLKTLLANIGGFFFLENFEPLEGLYFTDVAQSTKTFFYRVKRKYPDTQSDYAIGTLYDTIMILVQSFEQAETPNVAVNKLSEIKEYGGIVGDLEQDVDGVFNSRAVLKRVINGVPEVTIDEKAHHH